jgi:ribonuclease Y
MSILVWFILVLGVVGGFVVGYILRRYSGLKEVDSAESKAKELVQSAKNQQKEIILQAREETLKIIEDAKREEKERQKDLAQIQARLEKREARFDQKLLDLEERQQKIQESAAKLEKIKEKIRQIEQEQLAKLEEIAGLNQDEARSRLFEIIEQEEKDNIVKRLRELEKEGQEELEKKAKNILTDIIERCASSHAAEHTTTVVHLPSDEMKGRIIGREGRNIRAIEQLTGTEIIVDDTPETIIVSGFSLLRRQLAKRALDKLILDGRIQPARIERAVEEAKKELAQDIKKAGEEAAYRTGIAGLDPKLIQLLGRLKYRTSYGQNVLQHSVEVANLSALLATELGADAAVAKKAGLLHDIGKALDQDVQGTHPEIGKNLAEKLNLPEEVIIPIATHHEDHPPTLEAVIVKVADAISGARPGARRDTYENYLKRLEDLEEVAISFPGVEKAYAIQAGRELRVFVMPEDIDDLKAMKLSRKIADKIEEELKYPGEIKVTVIREKRITEYAR